jgi:hypothetical protein
MGSTRRRSADPTRASGFASPAQGICSPGYFASALVFSERHPHPHPFATHPAVGGEGCGIRTIQSCLAIRT